MALLLAMLALLHERSLFVMVIIPLSLLAIKIP